MYMNKIKNPNLLLAWICTDSVFWKKGLDMKGVWMCRAMEDMRNQTLKEGAINSAKRMLADGILTLEKIAEYAGLPLDEVKKLKAERTA
ncbi:hypothetical protein FMM80_17820 [Schaedlerella arabinosiphila]|uniref:Uncharacterized protein n=1 Tax=Schaedlerella arabinosiphila TaxID=2044587 RepID=A0A9X5C956_9FIRM|nr:hypothetical protein [Schaedlerella arabinosiphila]